MEFWKNVRREVLTGELSQRAACRKYGLGWHTLQKILAHDAPPGYRQKEPRRKRTLEPFLPVIEQFLEDDRQAPQKQRHTAHRIFERLRDEHGYTGGETVVKDAVRAWRTSHQEVFLPLSHPPGEAQVDFGEATVRLAGQETKVALFVMTLPYSGAIYVQAFPRECTETFLEGHRRAFEQFGGVPQRISYDNSATLFPEIRPLPQRCHFRPPSAATFNRRQQQGLLMSTTPFHQLFELIHQDVILIHAEWNTFESLFLSPQAVDALNELAPHAASMIEAALLDAVILAIARLTDPDKQRVRGEYADNATLEQLIAQLPDEHEHLRDRLSELLKDLRNGMSGFRDHRNKRIAHTDLQQAIVGFRLLPTIVVTDVRKHLAMLASFMNHLYRAIKSSSFAYSHSIPLGDGKDLVGALQAARKMRRLQQWVLSEAPSCVELVDEILRAESTLSLGEP